MNIKCSSITDNQQLKLSTVYSSLFVDFHELFGHIFRRHLVYSSFVYHTVLMQMQLWIVLQKRAFLCPREPPYNKGSGGIRPRGSGAPASDTTGYAARLYALNDWKSFVLWRRHEFQPVRIEPSSLVHIDGKRPNSSRPVVQWQAHRVGCYSSLQLPALLRIST